MRLPGGTLVAVLLVACLAVPAAAQVQPRRGRIIVTVADQSGLVVPNAAVRVVPQEDQAGAEGLNPVMTGGAGVAVVGDLLEGRYTVEVEFPGFETAVVRDVRVRGGNDTRRRVTLRIQRVEEDLTVSRDRQSSALDPKGSAFSSILTREQIEALPDDPDEMEAVLKAMSPPGSVLRVDGFTGGRLPPKSQIRSIRLPRMDMFAAQNHGGMSGMMFIDIMTMPGMGPLRGSADFSFRDEAMDARNAFTTEKAPEQLQQYGFNMAGTIKPNKTSFSMNAGGGYQYTSPSLYAVAPDGTTYTDTRLQQPRDSFNISGRLDHAVTKDHALRVSVDFDTSQTENLGVGGYNLFSRAYTSESANTMVRLSENGPIGRRMFSETRLQLRFTDSRAESALE
ncbi:MAG: Outer rane receptor for ferrienterochelin and colicin, partial [Acidobacteria bacterium]|nr:Outer rane receptor for ferrienterochelin and colicin [Acidobacteriota bacterium]